MALATYNDLLSAISTWMDRNDLSGNAADFVDLAEARLNREIDGPRKTASLSTVAASRFVSTSSIAIDQPVALFLDVGTGEVVLPQYDDASTPLDETAREPQRWRYDPSNDRLAFDAPSDAVYPVRFVYDERFALSDSVTTNDLLTKHPDVYLFACLVEAASFTLDATLAASYEFRLGQPLARAKRYYSNQRKSPLVVDPALSSMDRRGDWWYFS
jgi:hypothetical protein